MADLPTYYAGQGVTLTVKFLSASGVLTDPATASVKYRDAAGQTGTTTVALAALTKVSTGLYTLAIDTTTFVSGTWDVQIVSTGAIPACSVTQFEILARPLG